jgi:hypothetical protein
MTIHVERKDIDALWDYINGDAQEYFGMSYADGIRDMVEWLEGNSLRPDKEEAQ